MTRLSYLSAEHLYAVPLKKRLQINTVERWLGDVMATFCFYYGDIDLRKRILKHELFHSIPNLCMKIHWNPTINKHKRERQRNVDGWTDAKFIILQYQNCYKTSTYQVFKHLSTITNIETNLYTTISRYKPIARWNNSILCSGLLWKYIFREIDYKHACFFTTFLLSLVDTFFRRQSV